MSIGREIEDIARDLIKHQHDHPPVRDLNREVERRLTFADRVADDFSRLVGSWYFVLALTDPAAKGRGMSGFVVPADLPGITVGKKENNLGQRASDLA